MHDLIDELRYERDRLRATVERQQAVIDKLSERLDDRTREQQELLSWVCPNCNRRLLRQLHGRRETR